MISYDKTRLLTEISLFVPSMLDMLKFDVSLPTLCRMAVIECFKQGKDSDVLRQAIIDLDNGHFKFVERS